MPAAEASLVDELAQHLEDRFRELTSAGANEQEAYKQTVAELTGLAALQARPPNQEPIPLAGPAAGNLFEDLGGIYATPPAQWAKIHCSFCL
jgi:hypothetical protein